MLTKNKDQTFISSHLQADQFGKSFYTQILTYQNTCMCS